MNARTSARNVPPTRAATPMTPPVGLLVSNDAATMPHAESLALWRINGQTLMERAVTTLRQGGCQSIMVITGADGRRAGEAAVSLGARHAWNPQWTHGLEFNAWFGGQVLTAQCLPGTLVVVAAVEHLGLTPGTVRRAIEAWRPQHTVQTKFRGRPCLPLALPVQELVSLGRNLAMHGTSVEAYGIENRSALQWVDACGATASGSVLSPAELRLQVQASTPA